MSANNITNKSFKNYGEGMVYHDNTGLLKRDLLAKPDGSGNFTSVSVTANNITHNSFKYTGVGMVYHDNTGLLKHDLLAKPDGSGNFTSESVNTKTVTISRTLNIPSKDQNAIVGTVPFYFCQVDNTLCVDYNGTTYKYAALPQPATQTP